MTSTTGNFSRYVHRSKPLWNSLAIFYALAGYGGGISLFLLPNGWLNAFGVILFSHSLVISAYLAHEFMHGNMFVDRKLNAIGGNVVLWMTEGSYASFQDLMRMHIAHHVNRVDYCRFDLASFLKSLPVGVQSLLLGLEWLYFPSLAFVVRIRSILAPFRLPNRQKERIRVVLVFLIRAFLLTLLGLLSPKAVLLYFFSYIVMLHILRFVDAFQHTYEVIPVGAPLPKRNRTDEQANTFSNIISQRFWWLNLLLLNFSYHNAHHELMKCPWHSLHELDQELYTGSEAHYVTLPKLLSNYHRFRLSRIFTGQGKVVNDSGDCQLETFYGGIEVSFLVLP